MPQVTAYSVNGTPIQMDARDAPSGKAMKDMGTGEVSYAPVTSSSTSARADVNALGSTVKDLNASISPDSYTSGITSAYNTGNTLLKNYFDQLQSRRDAETKSINSGFDVLKSDTETKQGKETAGRATGLITSGGGFLGATQSHEGVLENLAVTHRSELIALESKRQAAILAAQNAYDDKQFAVAKEQVTAAKQYEADMLQSRRNFANDQLALIQEGRAQDTFSQTKAKNIMEIASTTGVLDTNSASYIDSIYGAGTAQKYIDVIKVDKDAKSQKALYDSFKSKLDLLESIPAGMKMQFGNETLTGLGKAGDLSTFHVEDGQGNVTLVTRNQRNGTITTQSLGRIGTPSSNGNGPDAGGNTSPIAVMTKDMNELASGGDGVHVTPAQYKEKAREWLSTGHKLSDFESNFKIFADPKKLSQYELGSVSYSMSPTQQLLEQFANQPVR